MRIFLDSDIVIYATKDISSLDIEGGQYYINPIVYAEVLYGFLYIGLDTVNLNLFLEEESISKVEIGIETAEIYAKSKLELSQKGTPIADNDLLVASSAIEYDSFLWTNNLKHFSRVRGLKIFKK